MNDTIAAISTTMGVGAISIIRVSGNESLNIVDKIFSGNLLKANTHTILYGFIKNNNEIIDEVLVSVMKGPKTFTMEDIVEINCHGSIASTNKILEILIEKGARLAEPGEFTKRAFLNGRIDLNQAEAVNDLINSKTELERKLNIKQLNGVSSYNIKKIRDYLISIISNIEVNIDYPEYEDIDIIKTTDILNRVKKIKMELNQYIKDAEDCNLIKTGIKVGIIGKPNVGKSSLLNALLEENKAIVSNIEGTTRDIVEGQIIIKGVIFNIIDTAGIRDTDNEIEKLGIDKSLKVIEESDLILFVLNNNDLYSKEEEYISEQLKNKKTIYIINKIDLEKKLDIENKITDYIEVSLTKNVKENIKNLKDRIIKLYNLDEAMNRNYSFTGNIKNISLLKKSYKSIETCIEEINNDSPIDIVELYLKECWNYLGEIIGETYTEEMLDEIFSRFCLGK